MSGIVAHGYLHNKFDTPDETCYTGFVTVEREQCSGIDADDESNKLDEAPGGARSTVTRRAAAIRGFVFRGLVMKRTAYPNVQTHRLIRQNYYSRCLDQWRAENGDGRPDSETIQEWVRDCQEYMAPVMEVVNE